MTNDIEFISRSMFHLSSIKFCRKINLFWFDTIYHFSPSYVIQYCRTYQLGAVAVKTYTVQVSNKNNYFDEVFSFFFRIR